MSQPQSKYDSIKAERDRYVSLAFTWADLLFEVDRQFSVVFAAGATRDPRTSLQRRAELVRARRWLATELRSQHPRMREEQWPWVEALGLRPRASLMADEEDWGIALVA